MNTYIKALFKRVEDGEPNNRLIENYYRVSESGIMVCVSVVENTVTEVKTFSSPCSYYPSNKIEFMNKFREVMGANQFSIAKEYINILTKIN